MAGYIKIDRKILDWEWWDDLNTYRLFTYMVIVANWEAGRFRGITVPRGSFVSSLTSLSEKTRLTVNEVRTALKHLASTGEITSKPHGKFTVFTVNNYDLYQGDHTEVTGTPHINNRQATGSPQPVNSLLTTIEEEKEGKQGRKEKREESITVSNDTVCQTDVRLIVEAWNELEAYGIKPVSRLNSDSKRYRSLVSRMRIYNTADIFTAIEKIKSSDFLQGKNKQGWTITFDWFVLPNNFPKVLEGNYDNKTASDNSQESSWAQKWRDA